ncbi:MAG: DnaD domain protein [Oscillospiraceae bacterium]|nr:DnaD domain protein [Oscillospiraceae bacterium]
MPDALMLPGEILSMSGAAASRLIAKGSGDGALLYLWLLRQAGEYDPQAAGRGLKWDLARTQAAFEELVDLKLADSRQQVSMSLPVPDEPPEYTAADLTKEMENTASPFPSLVTEVQRRLGKLLSTTDLKTLYMLYDYLALPAEVILLLVNWCVEEMERKYGEGHKPRMPQIRKEACRWQEQGLNTPEAVERFLRKQAVLHTREAQILPLLNIRDRQPIDPERRYIAKWVEWGFEDEAIRLAYERTILKKQSMNWAYMNSILRNWNEKGLRTVAAIEARDGKPARMPAGPVAPVPMPTPPGEADRRAREDMERLRAFMKQGGGG